MKYLQTTTKTTTQFPQEPVIGIQYTIEHLLESGIESFYRQYPDLITGLKDEGVSMTIADKHIKYYSDSLSNHTEVNVTTRYIPKVSARFDLIYEITTLEGELVARAALCFLFQCNGRIMLERPKSVIEWQEGNGILIQGDKIQEL